MLLNFSMGEDCPCPEDIQEELYDFHNELRLHCGKTSHICQGVYEIIWYMMSFCFRIHYVTLR